MDAVAAGPAADGDDPVARLDLLERLAAGEHADGAAEDQRIGQVARVDGQGPVDRGNSHPVAVVADAGDDPLEHAPGMEHAGRELIGGQVRRGDAEDVGVADRLGPQARAQGVADHAAEPGVGPAVGIDRRGVVVGLDLEADVVLVVEPDDAGVVGEDADQPVELEGLGRGEDRLLEQVVDRPSLELDPALQGLVRAVLAPGLGQGLELAVGRVAAESGEMRLDGLHLGEAQRELARPAHAPAAPRRPWRGAGTGSAGTRNAGPGPDDRTAEGRRWPARRRRWPARAGSAGGPDRPVR